MTQLNRQLEETSDENRQYQYISNHNLQEPLRKMRLFADLLLTANENREFDKSKELAVKISSSAEKFSMMLRDVSHFSELEFDGHYFSAVDLQSLCENALINLGTLITERKVEILTGSLPQNTRESSATGGTVHVADPDFREVVEQHKPSNNNQRANISNRFFACQVAAWQGLRRSENINPAGQGPPDGVRTCLSYPVHAGV